MFENDGRRGKRKARNGTGYTGSTESHLGCATERNFFDFRVYSTEKGNQVSIWERALQEVGKASTKVLRLEHAPRI